MDNNIQNIINDSYTAGIIDGEGTITLTKKSKLSLFRYPTISVSSTTYSILDFLYKTYDGHLTNKINYKSHHKQSWVWNLRNRPALNFLEKIYPYLKEPVKKYRANLLIKEYINLTPRNGKYTQNMKTKKLNFEHRFFHPSDTITNQKS